MNQRIIVASAAAFIGLFVLATSTFFTVDERQKAFVLQFGELKTVYDTPGLKMKIPFIQEVLYYDRRLLGYNLPAMEVLLGDQKRVVIDVFIRYVINNPVLFYKTLRDEKGARNRLASIVPNKMRGVVAKVPLSTLLSEGRAAVMDNIHQQVRAATASFGIDVRDVRIVRADLPQENSQAIFERMESERQREATALRAEGAKRSSEIHAAADRKRTEILAVAKRDAQLIRGQGEAEATLIYANAFGKDPVFFEFYRSMQAYPEALGPDTTFVLSPENDFFRHFEKVNGR